MKYKYKMEIRLNPNIPNNLNSVMVDKIKKLAIKNKLKNNYDNKLITIEGSWDNNDFAHIGVVMSTLKKTDWFKTYVISWLFYDSDGCIEDMIEHYHFR